MSAADFDLYGECLKIGATLDNHESDLYIKSTPETLALVKRSGRTWSHFQSQIDGQTWIDVPFAYTPFWEAKAR